MKPNLLQQPCSGKCTEFKNENCHACVITHIEKQEFDLGLAPEDYYVSAQFIHGDVVVLKQLNALCGIDLITLIRFEGQYWVTDHLIGRIHEDAIRIATTAELKAKQRLDDQVTQFATEAS